MDDDLAAFVVGFRDEHRAARDAFLGMAAAFRRRDAAEVNRLMGLANAGIGPHMRYEEEVMYPLLAPFFGPEYVEDMLHDHDRAFGVAGRLMELAAHERVSDDDVVEAEALVRGLLPHVSDCDGLALFIELLPQADRRRLVEARDRARREGLSMMEWGKLRGRAPAPPAAGRP